MWRAREAALGRVFATPCLSPASAWLCKAWLCRWRRHVEEEWELRRDECMERRAFAGSGGPLTWPAGTREWSAAAWPEMAAMAESAGWPVGVAVPVERGGAAGRRLLIEGIWRARVWYVVGAVLNLRPCVLCVRGA